MPLPNTRMPGACTTIIFGCFVEEGHACRSCGVLVGREQVKLLLRIEAGEEVIVRHCALPQNADEQTLRTAIEKAVAEEGYELDPATLVRC